MAILWLARLASRTLTNREAAMYDVLLLLLGAGGIAAMAGYAWLCERV